MALGYVLSSSHSLHHMCKIPNKVYFLKDTRYFSASNKNWGGGGGRNAEKKSVTTVSKRSTQDKTLHTDSHILYLC